MIRQRVVIHRTGDGFAATSPDLPGWVVKARSLKVLCKDVTNAFAVKFPSSHPEDAGH